MRMAWHFVHNDSVALRTVLRLSIAAVFLWSSLSIKKFAKFQFRRPGVKHPIQPKREKENDIIYWNLIILDILVLKEKIYLVLLKHIIPTCESLWPCTGWIPIPTRPYHTPERELIPLISGLSTTELKEPYSNVVLNTFIISDNQKPLKWVFQTKPRQNLYYSLLKSVLITRRSPLCGPFSSNRIIMRPPLLHQAIKVKAPQPLRGMEWHQSREWGQISFR